MKKHVLTVAVIATTIISCSANKKKSENATENKIEVRTVSAMKKVMMGEDLSAHLSWDTIVKEHLFAVAPLGRIEGEITIIDGEMYGSTVDSFNNISVKNEWSNTSPFAVMSTVQEWATYKLTVSISSEDELQTFIENLAQKNGYDLNKAFPFRIIGKFDKVDYHIISKPLTEEEHNHKLHNEAKKHFSLKNVHGQLLGFYSQNHAGVFTHRGHFIHTHFLDKEVKNAGHIDDLILDGNCKILLPIK